MYSILYYLSTIFSRLLQLIPRLIERGEATCNPSAVNVLLALKKKGPLLQPHHAILFFARENRCKLIELVL